MWKRLLVGFTKTFYFAFFNKPHSGNIVVYQKNKVVRVPAPREEEPGGVGYFRLKTWT
jgi:hypothetical protein